jgi:hypothetical protein
MQLTQKGRVFSYILLASALFCTSAITFGFFPYLGLSISFIVFALLAYSIKTDKTATTKAFFAITLVLSAFLAIRSEPSVTFIDLVGIFFFGSLFALSGDDKNFKNLFTIALTPVMLFLRSVFVKPDYSLDFKEEKTQEESQKVYLNSIIVGLVTIAVLAVILPLLSSTNPYFKSLIDGFLGFLGLTDIKIGETLAQWLVRLIFFVGLVFLIPRMATLINKHGNQTDLFPEGINLLVPKTVVAVVLLIFFATQLELYSASPETLAALGYTYSRYTNEVFAQLSVVAVIVLALLFMDTGMKKLNRKLALTLAVEGVFLTLMAYKSVYEYSSMWGFTYKRLYGFAVATWIMGVFLIYLYSFYKKAAKHVFALRSLIYTGIILIFVNLASFDYLIYHVRKPTTGAGVDYEYLSRLSADSLSFNEQLSRFPIQPNEIDLQDKQKAEQDGLFVLLYKIEGLQEKYNNLDIRGFNLDEYLQYLKVKNIETGQYRSLYKITPKSN